MVVFKQDEWIWIDHKDHGWIPVKMTGQSAGKINCRSQTNEAFEVKDSVSVNPFKMLPIYSPKIMEEYRHKMAVRASGLAPHVYALADNAYKALVAEPLNQSVVISGESGAGKTEACKLVLQYMAEMSGQGSDVEQQLLEANPIIEAFGNAKTVRNNNSSRFGKWCEINFDEKYHIIGAKIFNYLLEKSRIIMPGPGERNYHLFYQIAAGADGSDKQKWRMGHPMDYRILSTGNTWEVDGVNDREEFNVTKKAMSVLKFTNSEIEDIFRTTAAVLHLGNVDFTQQGEAAVVKDLRVVQVASDLLGSDPKETESALISQFKQMGRENVLTIRTQAQAEAGRDALCKAIYGHMFNWLIDRINKALAAKVKIHKNCGVLDIFGFEIFATNRFEQFCINFANEKMQQHFNWYIFTMEQEEYKKEKIDVAHIQHLDNQRCLDMIENGKNSILAMADEEIKLPKGSDENLLLRMHTQHEKCEYYNKPKTNMPLFGVAHYAGLVDYQIEGFMDKNKDSLEVNIAGVCQHSKSAFVAQLVPSDQGKTTLGYQFKTQLDVLMKTLKATAPHFIRCIKSNMLKVADNFDGMLVLRQLRYLGLKEVVNIRQLGYPVRKPHPVFFKRYKVLAPEFDPGINQPAAAYGPACTKLLGKLAFPPIEWRVGITKTFTKSSTAVKLEALRDKAFEKYVLICQKYARAKIWRRRFKAYRVTEQRLRASIRGDDVTEIEEALAAYEGLHMNLKPDLVEAAVKRKNELGTHVSVKRALEQAIKAKDATLLQTAITEAESNKVDPNHAILVSAKKLVLELQTYSFLRDKALEGKDLQQIEMAIAQSIKIGLDGPNEKSLIALKQQLESADGVKKNVQQAMAGRDLDALKNALKSAMENGALNQLNNALLRAQGMGLDDDPLVQQAMLLEPSLEQEVSTGNIAKELKASIESGDFESLQTAVRAAQDAGLNGHHLTKEAQDMMDKIQQTKQIYMDLTLGMENKDEKLLVATCADAEDMGLTDSPEYVAAKDMIASMTSVKAQLIEAVRKKDAMAVAELVAKAEAIGIDAKEIDAASTMNNYMNTVKEVQTVLQAGMDSDNAATLEAAINKAKDKGMPTNHSSLVAALAKLDELKQLEKLNTAESKKAAAMVANRGTIIQPRRGANGKTIDAARVNQLFDRNKYMANDYDMSCWPNLRSINDFMGGGLLSGLNKNKNKVNMFRYTKDVIPKSLTDFQGEFDLSNKSVEIFKAIQGFMGDRHYSYPDTLVCEVIDDVMLWEELRDECYLQVMKQLSYNPKPDSDHKGWMLLSLLAEFVPPHEDFVPFICHFIETNANSELLQRPYVSLYANYTLHTLKDTFKKFNYVAPIRKSPEFREAVARKEQGKHVPFVSVDHVTAFRDRSMVPASIKITLPDNTCVRFEISPWERNSHIIRKVCEMLQINDQEGLALFEMRGIDSQYLYPHECLLDFERQWRRNDAKAQVTNSKKGFFSSLKDKISKPGDEVKSRGGGEMEMDWSGAGPGGKRFLLKRRVFGKPVGESFDAMASKIMFLQTAREIAMGFHNLEEPIATTMAAVTKTLSEKGKLTPIGQANSADGSDAFVSVCYWDCPLNLQALKVDPKRFSKNVDKVKGEIQTSTMEAYMHEAIKLVTFGANFYRVERADENTPTKLPDFLIVAINYYGIYLLDPDTREILDQYPLINVLGWSSSSVRVVIKVKLNTSSNGSGISTATFRFNTRTSRTGKEVCDLLLCYANEMMKAVGKKK